ncbi:sugar phosphate isomerase/epimerase family protein [Paenibacillus sp. Y412MC10]|uniref:sugar phosphate isomerase/epimerase family protein n=1 Tax=Geobacillus sp. (strain Y412MC10) TaxID=481743 RepID=UPI00017894D8|nr:sugar phosphate isomerase/epimerase family protein [Paenibacillus sp. Y412MC10]ACX63498.1 Xylose isomerase domain protein TIM barrel [Paenibacillus sp. Y412MC10]
MKIAAFSGSLIDYSIHEAMSIAAELAFDGIEIACREPHLSPETSLPRVREMKALADGHGLEIPALAGYMGLFSTSGDAECAGAYDQFMGLLERAVMLEAGMIRIFQGGPNAFLAEDYHYAKAAFWIRKCAEEARAAGKRIVLEIHNQSLVETTDSALRLLELIGDDQVGLIHDAGNMYITDTEFGEESVRQLGSRLFHVHIKDERRIGQGGAPGTFKNLTRHGEEFFLQCRLGEGEVDHGGLLRELREQRYAGWLTLECAAPYPPKERLAYDLLVIKEWLQAVEVSTG